MPAGRLFLTVGSNFADILYTTYYIPYIPYAVYYILFTKEDPQVAVL